MDEKIRAVVDAARLYAKWAADTGDYPHDEKGCNAHDEIVKAVAALDGKTEGGRSGPKG